MERFEEGDVLQTFDQAMLALAHGHVIERGNFVYELGDCDTVEDFKDMIVSLKAIYDAGLTYSVES